MALDGNGTYSPPAPQFPAIPNTVIYADDFNQIILDIAAALSTAIFRDGQAAFTADQSMGGNKLTNLANGANAQDAVTVLQVFTDPNFIATTADGVKITGTALTIAVGQVKYTGTKVDLGDVAEVILPEGAKGVTASTSDSSTKLATTNFVQSVAFNTALPAQAGNPQQVVTTDGENASWTTGGQDYQVLLKGPGGVHWGYPFIDLPLQLLGII